MYEKIKGEKFTLDLYSGKIPLLKTLLIVKLSKLSSFRATSAFRVTWSEQHHLKTIIITIIMIIIINNNNIFYCANFHIHMTEIH